MWDWSMEKNIKIFYHAYLINNYKDIITEQLTNIFYSELYKNCQEFHIGIVGGEEAKKWIINLVEKYSKIKLYFFDNGDEKNTLNLIPLLSRPNDYILYLHTKGITHIDEIPQHLWRKLLNYKTINEWKKCIEILDNCDCVGPLYREDTYLGYFPHFSGGFWWSKYEYITTLDNSYLDENYIHKRMGAEFWIGSNPNSKMKCLYTFDGEPSIKEYTIKDYINE
jgi:hypothetical protein